jgi:SAM-dependent methyltransferase
VRRETFRAFARSLRRGGPAPHEGAAADLGAGTGWLAHHLAEWGYRTVAMDASLDPDFGLGASDPYRSRFSESFLATQADLEALPLQEASFGLVVFNASLHYVHDLVSALRRVRRALRPGGWVVILDTPIERRGCPGTGIGDRHLGRQELEDALRASGLLPRWVKIRRGLRWHAYQLRAAIRGDDRFAFPMVIGAASRRRGGR